MQDFVKNNPILVGAANAVLTGLALALTGSALAAFGCFFGLGVLTILVIKKGK